MDKAQLEGALDVAVEMVSRNKILSRDNDHRLEHARLDPDHSRPPIPLVNELASFYDDTTFSTRRCGIGLERCLYRCYHR